LPGVGREPKVDHLLARTALSSVLPEAEHIKALDAICIITQQGATAATIPG